MHTKNYQKNNKVTYALLKVVYDKTKSKDNSMVFAIKSYQQSKSRAADLKIPVVRVVCCAWKSYFNTVRYAKKPNVQYYFTTIHDL